MINTVQQPDDQSMSDPSGVISTYTKLATAFPFFYTQQILVAFRHNDYVPHTDIKLIKIRSIKPWVYESTQAIYTE